MKLGNGGVNGSLVLVIFSLLVMTMGIFVVGYVLWRAWGG